MRVRVLLSILCVTVACPAAAGAAPVQSKRCAVLANGQSCSFYPSSTPQNPYLVTMPSGVTSVTAVVTGATGAAGDENEGGAGGVVVATLPVTPDAQYSLWVGSNGVSYDDPGQGFAPGGSGIKATAELFTDSGAGGGASALVGPAGDLVVAGGGGGAGGTYNNIAVGGDGGSGSDPAGDGASGGSPPGGKDKDGGGPGGDGGGQSGEAGENGGSLLFEGGGGGGGGWQGGDGGDPGFVVAGGGGGGGGGLSWINPGAGITNAVYGAARSGLGGSITLIPSAASQTFYCSGQASQAVHLGSPTATVFAIVAGASGNQSSDNSELPGTGAVVTGLIEPRNEQNLAVTVGCKVGEAGYGPGGAKGDAGRFAGDDGGYGGGGSAIVDAKTGNAWLIAGGGGGAGGRSLFHLNDGGAGGDAGLGWGATGAGWGLDSAGGQSGGQGAANTSNGQPVMYGDSPAEVESCGGGGGAGGGGLQGGEGGDTINACDGGGGGGAGSSTYDRSHVANPTVATATADYVNGFVTLVQEPAATATLTPVAHAPVRALASGNGSFRVTATVRGNAAAAHRRSVFGLRVICRMDGRDVRTPGGFTFGLRSGRSRTISGLAIGTRCRVDQTNTAFATRTAISARYVTVAARRRTVTVTNTFNTGRLTVRLLGRPGLGTQARAHRVRVYIQCRSQRMPPGSHLRLPRNGYLKVSANHSLTLRGLATGARCAVAPLDNHYADTARTDRETVIRTHRRAVLRIRDAKLLPTDQLTITPASGPSLHTPAAPDTRITITRGPTGALRTTTTSANLEGATELGNHAGIRLTIRITRGTTTLRQFPLTSGASLLFNP